MVRLNQSRRQQIGYVYKPQVNNNIATVQIERHMAKVQETDFMRGNGLNTAGGCNKCEMEGEGYMDILRGAYNLGMKGFQNRDKIMDAYTSETATTLKNIIPSSDKTARPLYPGENHMILKLPNGRSGYANFMGPGTEIEKRLKRGDPGRTPSDMVAKMHDTQYALAQNASDKREQARLIRQADNRMINSLKAIKAGKHGGDKRRNITAGMRLIQAKKVKEDLTGTQGSFGGPLKKHSAGDMALLKGEEKKLEMMGYGNMLPGDILKMKLLKKMSREKKMKSLGDRVKSKPINAGVSGGKAVFNTSKAPYKTKNKNKGASYRRDIAGQHKLQGNGDMNTMIKQVALSKPLLNSLVKKLGINPKEVKSIVRKYSPIVNKVIKMKMTPQQKIKIIAKALHPLLGQAKMKGYGISLAGSGISSIAKGAFNTLNEKLAKAMLAILKSRLKSGYKNYQKGSGFFEDFGKGFVKGFKSVWKPGSKILAPIVGATNPALGTAIGISGELM